MNITKLIQAGIANQVSSMNYLNFDKQLSCYEMSNNYKLTIDYMEREALDHHINNDVVVKAFVVDENNEVVQVITELMEKFNTRTYINIFRIKVEQITNVTENFFSEI